MSTHELAVSTECLIYDRIAQRFAIRIEDIFTSEETLKTAWEKHLPGLPFDRTDRWNVILLRELEAVWKEHGPAVKSSMTGADRQEVLKSLSTLLDFNLFSQVLLNLQSWSLLCYRLGDAAEEVKALETKWAEKSPSPFDAKAKMFKGAANEEQSAFNHTLSTLKSQKIIEKVTPFVSFRVTQKVSTPALVDSCNLSMLGVGGDQYLSPRQLASILLHLGRCA